MTFATDPKPAGGAAQLLEHTIDQLTQAQKLLRELQEMFAPGGPFILAGRTSADTTKVWHALETIDDRLHDALSALGD